MLNPHPNDYRIMAMLKPIYNKFFDILEKVPPPFGLLIWLSLLLFANVTLLYILAKLLYEYISWLETIF